MSHGAQAGWVQRVVAVAVAGKAMRLRALTGSQVFSELVVAVGAG